MPTPLVVIVPPADEPEPLPELFQRWMATAVGSIIPRERKATCQDCAMARDPSESATSVRFEPNLKCCTFLPELPNFLVGRILSDSRPEASAGRASMAARIRQPATATPLGVGPPPSEANLYDAAGSSPFGRSERFLCPHYDRPTGGCTVWRHRNSVCTTWFCKHNRGILGHRFWQALRLLLGRLERELAIYAATELLDDAGTLKQALDGSTESIATRLTDELVPELTRARHRRLWGPWAGREIEFYVASANLIEGLSWERVVEIGGASARARLELVRSALAELSTFEIPNRLTVIREAAQPAAGRLIPITTHNPADPVTIPGMLLPTLGHFDGRPTETVLEELEQSGTHLPPEFVLRLVDYGVLVPPSSPAPLTPESPPA